MPFFPWARWLRSWYSRTQRPIRVRRGNAYSLTVEALEDRTLLAVLPAALVSNPQTLPKSGDASIDAQVAYDPLIPNDMVAVASYNPTDLTKNTPGLEVWYSTNSGATWSGTPLPVNNLNDPNIFNPNGPYVENSGASVAFDRLDNFYIAAAQHDATNTSGAITLVKFSFSGAVPVQQLTYIDAATGLPALDPAYGMTKVLYSWFGQDPAFNPVVGIDNNTPSFTDPTTKAKQSDSMANNVVDQFRNPQAKAIYVAWNTLFTEPAALKNKPQSESLIWVSASDDGASNFTTTQYVTGYTPNVATVTFSAAGGVVFSYDGVKASALAETAATTAAQVQTDLRAIAALSAATVTGAAGGPYTVTFPSGVTAALLTVFSGPAALTPTPTFVSPLPGSSPSIVFTQGTADGRVAGGQLIFVWSGSISATPNPAPLMNQIVIDSSSPDGGVATNPAAAGYTITNNTPTPVADATTPVAPATPPPAEIPGVTDSLITANVADPNFGVVNDLDVAVNLVDPHVNDLTITLTYLPYASIATISFTAAGSVVFNYNATSGSAFPESPVTTAAQLQGNLRAITGLNAVTVTGSPGGPFTVNFPKGVNPALFTVFSGPALFVPTPATVYLVDSAINPVDGTTIKNVGLPDAANLGVLVGGANNATVHDVGTVFDSQAVRAVNDSTASAPYIGHFQPETAPDPVTGKAYELTIFNGLTAAQVNLPNAWQLEVTDNLNDGAAVPAPGEVLESWSLNFSSQISTTQFGKDTPLPTQYTLNKIAYTTLNGGNGTTTGVNDQYDLVNTVSGTAGIAPSISVAIDNTLGSFSPYQGTIYVAYTGYSAATIAAKNIDLNNTDVFLMSSTDGGATWSPQVQVNDDSAADNFSEGNRPQFMPTVAVDQTTGTVGVMYYDGRWDPALTRAANSFSASVDGGATFSPSTFFNTPSTAIDAVTGKTITIEPIPGNQPQADEADNPYGFGDRQGLVIYGGKVVPVFSSNDNSGGAVIKTAIVTIAAGPRIIYGDMGPITADFNSPVGGTTYNNVFTSDGTRAFTGFSVEFDRPVLVSSFTPSLVQIIYRDTVTPTSLPGTTIPVADYTVVPQDAFFPFGLLPASTAGLLATTFLIEMNSGDALSGVGTYSYAITPSVTDGIRTAALGTGKGTTGNMMDQNQDAISGEGANSLYLTAAVPPSSADGANYKVGDILTVSGGLFTQSAELEVTDVDTTGAVTGTVGAILSVSILQVGLYSAPPPNPVLVTGGSGTGAKFNLGYSAGEGSTSLFVSSATIPASADGKGYKVGDLLTLAGGAFSQVAELKVASVDTTGIVTGVVGAILTVSIFQPGVYSAAPVNAASVTGGTGTGATFDVTFNGSLGDFFAIPTPVGGAPFTLPYKQDTLPLIIPGPHMVSTSVAFNPNASTTATDNLVLNGTNNAINVTFDRNIQPASFTPANIISMMGPTGPITSYGMTTPAAIVGAVGGVPGVLTSTLNVSDSLVVNNLSVGVNITYARDADLSAVLVAPDGTQVPLFSGGTGANFTGTIFDNYASTPVTAGTGPYTGIFRPVGTLSSLNGKNYLGTWKLVITDSTPGAGGAATLNSWTLNPFTVAPVEAVTSALISAGGSGYLVGDILTVQGGTFQSAAQFQVTGVDSTGKINSVVAIVQGGAYTALPANPASVSGGTGTGATFNLSFSSATTTFQIGFSTQALSGTYNLVVGPDSQGNYIQDVNGYEVDTNLNAGVDLLRGGDPNNGTVIANAYPSGTLNTPLPPGQTVNSSISVPASFLVNGVTVQLTILHQHDPDLTATLISPDGTSVQLFSGVGNNGTDANFTGTTLDDSASSPIQLAPVIGAGGIGVGPYTPQLPLSTFKGLSSLGNWVLRIQSSSSTLVGTLVSWTLTLKSSVPGSGLGEPVADQFTVHFRIFTEDPTNPQSSTQWVAMGPAAIDAGDSAGRIGGIAVDPSDPSGNTAYVAGASGDVWKTTDFLTTDPNGPTYVPLTNFGQGNSLNTESIAVFGRNNNPSQSIIFAATGEGSTGTPGVGFLRSMDGGRTWNVLDSTTNVDAAGNVLPINSASRNHMFDGTTAFKVIVDPTPLPNGQVIVYAALGNGVWRSTDTGGHWTLLAAGDATDVVLAAGSAGAGGNLQILYAAIEGLGVYYSPHAPTTASLSILNGGQGVPIRRNIDNTPDTTIPVANPTINPSGANGRIVLAVPALTGNPLQDTLQEGWLYAAVSTTSGVFQGLYVTKDFGLNWTKIRLPVSGTKANQIATNDDSIATDYSVDGGKLFPQANYNVTLAVDPNNPNVVYFGGTSDANPNAGGGFIRVDITTLQDPYAAVAYDNSNNDGGLTQTATTGGVGLTKTGKAYGLTTSETPYFDLLRDPNNPFLTPTSLEFTNVAQFNNSGEDARWGTFGGGGLGGTDQHELIAMRDPLTGHTMVIFGDDQGIWVGNDQGDGTSSAGIGTARDILGSRNGNLQITQLYQGAAQPSTLAADIAGALFYAVCQDDGFPVSDPNLLQDGNIGWGGAGDGDASGVVTDPDGSGTVYYYKWPCCGASPLAGDFYSVLFPGGTEVSRVSGLLQAGDDPANQMGQWPFLGGSRSVVNPFDPTAIVMSSSVGRVFLTSGPTLGTGVQWFPIADPTDLDSSYAGALAFGAPSAAGSTNLDNFIYAGTSGGHIYVTFTGGGTGVPWTDISAGLDGSAVQEIVTNPTFGSHEAYAVTSGGVFYMANSSATNAKWVNITSNLFSPKLTRILYNDPNQVAATLLSLATIQADWRYAIPDNLANPTGPTHPVLYVGGQGGVYRSLDKGVTWTYFPDEIIDGALQQGGFLPSVQVTQLSLSVGNFNPATGQPIQSTGLNLLSAATYGEGTFGIRLNASILLSNGLPLSTYAVSPYSGPRVVSIAAVSPTLNQYASTVIAFSTEYSTTIASASQALGAPDSPYGPYVSAWAPSTLGQGTQEFLTLGYTTPVFASSVDVRETDGNGFVTEIDLLDTNGVYHKIFSGPDNTPEGTPGDLVVNFSTTSYLVKGVNVDVNTAHDPTTYEQIDALQLTGTPGANAINVTFSGEVDPATFTTADLIDPTTGLSRATDPSGHPLAVSAVLDENASGHNLYQIVLANAITVPGFYHVSLGPNISDFAGNKMDQNQNSVNGESPGDVYTGRFLYQPFTNDAPILTATTATVPAILENTPALSVPGASVNSMVASMTPAPGIADPDNGTTASATLTGLNGPDALAFDGNGNLYVANSANNTVSEFATSATTPSATFNGLHDPVALAFNASGNLFVADFGNNTVSVFRAGTTTLIATLTGLNGPTALAVDGSGDLFVANSANNTVSEFRPGITVPTTTLTGLNAPDALAFDGSGNLYVANGGVGTTVSVFAPGATTPTATLTGLNAPNALAFDGHGNLFVVNPGNSPGSGTISEFAPAATTPTATIGGLTDPSALAFASSGNLYVNNGPVVSEFTSGATTPTATLTGLNAPTALASDGNGHLFVANFNAGTVSKFVSPGYAPQTAPVGVAITGVDDTNGTWEYSLDSGNTWNNIVASPAAALLLEANSNGIASSDQVRFLPNAGFTGTAAFTFQGWDETSGLNPVTEADGGTANVVPNGGTTAFSLASATATVMVNPINQPPTFIASNPSAVNENSGAAFVATWAAFTPGLPGETVLAYQVTNVGTPSLFSVQPKVDASGNLTYTPAANASGTSTFTVTVQESGGTANGGHDTAVAQTFTITVNFVNQPPSFTASSPAAVNENSGAATLNNWATFSAGKGNGAGEALKQYHVTAVGNPALFSSPPAVANNGTLTYTPAANTSGTSTFTVTVQDTGGAANGGQDTSAAQTFTITVNFVNQRPTFAASTPAAVNENSGAASVPNWATFTPGLENDSGEALKQYNVTSVGNSALFGVLPAVDNNGNLTYTPAANMSGASTFTVTAQDAGGMANGGQDTSVALTFTITVNFVNQPPTFTASSPAAVNENGGAATVNNWAAFNAGPGNGAGETFKQYHVTAVGNPLLFGVPPAVANNGTLTYTPAANTSGTSTFTVTAQDTGGTANGGQDTSVPQTFTITVNFVNQRPTFTASTPPAFNENSGAASVPNWATFTPGLGNDPGEALKQYNVTAVGDAALFSVPPAVANNGTLTYTPAANMSGTSTFTVTAQDAGGTANGGQDTSVAQTFTINVNFVNQAPTLTASNPSPVNENSGPASVPNWAAFTPGAPGETVIGYTVSNVSNQALFSAQPSVDASGNLTYTPATNMSGSATFAVTVQETGGTANGGQDTSVVQVFQITVYFVNTAPTFTASSPQAVNENNGPVTVANWATFAPGVAGETVVAYHVTNVSNSSLFSVQPAVDALGNLTYTPAANTSGTSAFTASVQESGGAAHGGNDTSLTETFSITVNFVNQPPTFAVASGNPPAVNENSGPVALANWAAFIPGPGNDPGEAINAYHVSNISNATLFTVAPTVANNGTLTYTPAANAYGSATFTVNVQDLGGTAHGGHDTSPPQTFTIAVNFVNQPPTFTAANPTAVNQNNGPTTVSHWATYSAGGNGAGEDIKAYHVTNVGNSALFSVLPSVDANGTLTYTPAATAQGSSTFSVSVQDTGGTGNGGHDTSATQVFTILITFVNLPPTFSAASPLAVNENSGAASLASWAAFTAGVPGETLVGYHVTGVGNASLFSVPPAVDNSGTLTYTPATNMSGTSTFTVTAQETGGTANGGQDTSVAQTFTITVNFVNLRPTFSATNPPAVNENSGAATAPNWANFSPGLPGETILAYKVTNVGTSSLFSVAPKVDSSGNLTYTPAANAFGTSTFTVTAQETGGTGNGGQDTSLPTTFTITVNLVNKAPTLSATNPAAVNENSGATSIPAWATFTPGVTGETVLGYTVTTVGVPSLFSVAPMVDTSGNLTYTPAANASGTSTFTVVLQESGGALNGGQDTSAPQTFALTVNFVNQAPRFTASNPPFVLENRGPASVSNWATYIPGPGNASGEALLAYHVTNVTNPSLFSVAPSVDVTGKLTYAPAAGVFGTSSVTVTAQDQGGTGNGGHDTSVPQTFTFTVQGPPTPLGNQEMSYTQANMVVNLTQGSTYQLQQAGTPAWFLSENDSFIFTGNYTQNYGGANEKWLKGTINQFNSPWYFIEPNGQVFAWDQTPKKASGAVVASLDPVYWYNPALLWEASPASYAQVLQQSLGLTFTGNFYQNYDGFQERWLQGTGGTWYYITPNGKVFTGSGTLLASLDPIYYNEPARLYNAAALSQNVSVTLNTPIGSAPSLTVTPNNSFVGTWVIHLITTFESVPTINQFNVVVDNHLPALSALSPQTLSQSTGPKPLSVSLAATDADGDSLSYAADGGTQGYVLQTIYNLSFSGSYYTNDLGLNEKWMKGLINQYNNPWYILLPNGQFYAWNGATNAVAALRDPLHNNNPLVPLATLDQPALYWNESGLLFQNSANNDLSYALQHTLGLHVSGSLAFNSFGYGESWLRDSSGAWYYIQANGQMYLWGNTKSKAQDTLLTTLPVLASDTSSMSIATRLAGAQPGQFAVTLTGNAMKVAPNSAFIGDIWVLAGATDDASNPLNRRFAYQYFKVQVVP